MSPERTDNRAGNWIDAHCHLADPRLRAELPAVRERSLAAGVTAWVQGGVCPDDWQRQRELRAAWGDGVYPVFGVHPWWVGGAGDAAVTTALRALESALDGASALGELGLDASPRFAAHRESQLRAFETQLGIGRAAGIPLVLHVVRAHAEALALLRRHGPFRRGGIVHAFSGSAEIGQEYLDLGFALSVGGVVTRPGYTALKKGLPQWPGDRLLVETDCPDQVARLPGLAPDAWSEPAHLPAIAEAIGRLRGEDARSVLDRSRDNLRRLLGMTE